MAPHTQRRSALFARNCTHTTMSRAYDVACEQCGRKPDLGWVYVCTQDKEFGGDPWKGIAQYDDLSELNEDSPLHIQLEKLGHSKSIVNQAKNGEYTVHQIEILKLQKQDLREKIKELHPSNQPMDDKVDKKHKSTLIGGKAQAKLSEEAAETQGSIHKGLANEVNTDEKRALEERLKAILYPPCKSTFCHHCKPHFRARAASHIDDAIDLLEPLQSDDFANTPIFNANILRTIGTKPVPLQRSGTTRTFDTSNSTDSSNTSDITWVTTASAREQIERQADLTGAFYGIEPTTDDDLLESDCDWSSIRDNIPSIRESVKTAVKDFLKPARKPSAEGDFIVWPEKGIFGPQSALQTSTSTQDFAQMGINDPHGAAQNGFCGLRGAMQKRIHIPHGAIKKGSHAPQDAAQGGDLGLMRAQSGGVEDDMDAESDGGISLTEEAAETHTPDIITQA